MKPSTSVLIFACLLLFYSTITFAANTKQNPGIIIPDVAPYPLYQYSKIELSESGQLPTLHLNFTDKKSRQSLISVLENLGVNIEHADNSDEVKTDWISWHFDEESRQSQSKPRNNFFSLDFRDRYRFTFIVIAHEKHTDINLKKVERSEEKDITPDTEITWLKWQDEKPDKKAIHDFLKRLQTEYEKLALTSSTPVAHVPIVGTVRNNQITLNMTVEQAWAALLKQLKQKSISLANKHNNQHVLNTNWHYADYDTETPVNTKTGSQRHQFQLMVIPGSSLNTSSILVYHTAFQQNFGSSAWSNENTQKAIAAEFLHLLNLNQ